MERLTTTRRAQAWLAPDQGTLASQNDEMIGRLIGSVSGLVLNAMNRDTLARTTRTESYDGGRTDRLVLRHWPVLSVGSLSLGSGSVSVQASDYTLEGIRPSGGCQRIYMGGGRTFQTNTNGVGVTYTTGFVRTETVHVSSASPYTAQLTDMVLDVHSVVDNGTTVTTATFDDDGLGTFLPAQAGHDVQVTYSYVPADIEQVVIDEVGAFFRSRQRIGEYSKALPQGGGTVTFNARRLMDISLQALNSYRLVVPQ